MLPLSSLQPKCVEFEKSVMPLLGKLVTLKDVTQVLGKQVVVVGLEDVHRFVEVL